MQFLQPVQRAGEEEVLHLVAAEVEDERGPVLVLAQARVLVFVERRPIEARQGMTVFRKVGWHPVHDHADAIAVAVVHEVAEVVGIPEAARGRIVARGLVAPGRVVREFRDGQQLEVGKAHPADVFHKPVGQLAVVEETAFGIPLPGAQMDFVHGHGLVLPVVSEPLFHPRLVFPEVGGRGGHDGGGARSQFELLSVGIGLGEDLAGVAVPDLEFVEGACAEIGNEELPDACPRADPHGMAAPVPAVEIPHDADALGVGSPHRKQHPGHAIHPVLPRAQAAVGVPVLALAEEMQVEVGELRQEGVGIMSQALVMAAIDPDQPVMERQIASIAPPFEQVAFAHSRKRTHAFENPHLVRMGQKDAHDGLFAILMAPQQGEGIVVPRLQQPIQILIEERSGAHGWIPWGLKTSVAPGRRAVFFDLPPSRNRFVCLSIHFFSSLSIAGKPFLASDTRRWTAMRNNSPVQRKQLRSRCQSNPSCVASFQRMPPSRRASWRACSERPMAPRSCRSSRSDSQIVAPMDGWPSSL